MESYNAVNITLDVFSAAITILILVYLVSRRNNTKENRCFLWICIWNLLFILGDLSDWCCNGLAHSWYAIVLPVGQFIYYAVLAPFMITMLDYVSAYLSNYGRISPVYKYIIYVLAGLHSLGCILTPFTGLYYEISEDNIYYRGTWVALASVLPIVMYLIVTVLAFRFRKKLCGRAFMALLSYMCFPMLGHVIQNIFRGVATLNPAITLAILFIFFNIQLDRDVQHEKDKQKLMEANVKVMLSQIRPHFLLNTLAAIQGLCDIEPEKAKASINDFSMFLRANMNSLTNDEVIPFEQELLHVRSYLNLIQQMYGNRIQVMYDIQGKEFYLPSLSMQPIVENAVYKGLLTKKEGGTITIRTREENNGFWIFIEDNGVGFSMDVLKEEGHLGIDNVKRRIEIMCNGKVLLDSVVGKGTSIGLYLPKNSGEC